MHATKIFHKSTNNIFIIIQWITSLTVAFMPNSLRLPPKMLEMHTYFVGQTQIVWYKRKCGGDTQRRSFTGAPKTSSSSFNESLHWQLRLCQIVCVCHHNCWKCALILGQTQILVYKRKCWGYTQRRSFTGAPTTHSSSFNESLHWHLRLSQIVYVCQPKRLELRAHFGGQTQLLVYKRKCWGRHATKIFHRSATNLFLILQWIASFTFAFMLNILRLSPNLWNARTCLATNANFGYKRKC